jgi:hypothetical protein
MNLPLKLGVYTIKVVALIVLLGIFNIMFVLGWGTNKSMSELLYNIYSPAYESMVFFIFLLLLSPILIIGLIIGRITPEFIGIIVSDIINKMVVFIPGIYLLIAVAIFSLYLLRDKEFIPYIGGSV